MIGGRLTIGDLAKATATKVETVPAITSGSGSPPRNALPATIAPTARHTSTA